MSFSTIPGVTEDVTEIILTSKASSLNIGATRLTAFDRCAGAGEVTAKDIITDETVEIFNPDQHIATLGDNAKLRMDLWGPRPGAAM